MRCFDMRIGAVACLFASLLLPACKGTGGGSSSGGATASVASELSPQQLHDLVGALAQRLGIRLRAASKEIEIASSDRTIKRSAVHWKIVCDGYFENARFHADPHLALIDLWVFTLQMREYLENGDGREIFGP